MRVVKPSSPAKALAHYWMQAGLLDQGEAEALAHARETRADGFLTDDADARELALAQHLEVRGSLGVVLGGAACGQINHAEASKILERLEHASSLWLSTKVRRAAHAALKQIYPD